MSPKNTRTRSLERQNIVPKKLKSRKFSELSPEQKEMSNNDQKKSKPEDLHQKPANDQNKKSEDPPNMLEKIQAGIDAMNFKMDELSKNLTQQIDTLTNEMHEIRADLKSTKDKMKSFETKQIEVYKSLDTHEVRLNIIDQKSLDTQLMISNLPKNLDTETFMDSLFEWSGNTMNPPKINSVNYNTYKDTKTAFVHFQNQGDKEKVMDHVKKQQKDTNGEHTPILCEQIIKMKEDDPDRTKIIYFQTPLTPFNRKIVDRVKQMKKAKSIERYWLMKGSIYIKLPNQEKSIRIDCKEHLDALKSSTPMEIE